MDNRKFNERTCAQIEKSLKFQHLDKDIKPLEIIEFRDRYFLVMCEKLKAGRKSRYLFLRYDRWFFYLEGLYELPPLIERRDYRPVVRKPLKEKELVPKIRPDIIIDRLDETLAEIKRQRPENK